MWPDRTSAFSFYSTLVWSTIKGFIRHRRFRDKFSNPLTDQRINGWKGRRRKLFDEMSRTLISPFLQKCTPGQIRLSHEKTFVTISDNQQLAARKMKTLPEREECRAVQKPKYKWDYKASLWQEPSSKHAFYFLKVDQPVRKLPTTTKAEQSVFSAAPSLKAL